MPPRVDASVFADLGRLIDQEENGAEESAPRPEFRPLLGENQALAYDSWAKYMLVYGERYSGKCVAPSTIVYANGGLKRIGTFTTSSSEVSEIDVSVQAFDGAGMMKARATAFYRNPSRAALRLTFSNGLTQIVSPEHPLWTEHEGRFEFAKGSDLLGRYVPLVSAEFEKRENVVVNHWSSYVNPGRYIAFRKVMHLSDRKAAEVLGVSAGMAWKFRRRNAGADWNTEITEDVAYTIGAMVGDGCTRTTMGFTNADAEVVARVSRGLAEIGCDIVPRGGIQYGICGKRVTSLFAAIGARCNAHDKRVPDCIIESPRSVIVSFLRGLFDTDGTVNKNGDVQFCSVSRDLIDDVSALLLALGLHPVVTFKANRYRGAFILSLWGRQARKYFDEIGFEIKRKQERMAFLAPAPRGQNRFPSSILTEMRRVRSEYLSKIGERPRAWHDAHRGLLGCRDIPAPEKLDRFIALCGTSDRLEVYRKYRWVRIEKIEGVESDLVDIEVPGPHTFCGNGLIHHNSHIGGGHKLVRHLWRNFNALAIILVGVKSQATQGGIWEKLQTMILPEWKAGQGLEYTEVKFDLQKNPYIDVTNKFGGWSRVVLISAPVPEFLRKRIRGYEASYVFIDEITMLDSPVYFTAVVQQVGRRKGITDPQQLVAACNPEGPSHWVYQRWWVLPLDDNGDYNPKYQKIHLPSAQNPDKSPEFYEYMETVRDATKGDPIEEARMIRGEWIDRPSGTALFKDYYVPQLHRVGEGRKRILPNPHFPVIIGYDLGTANNAITLMQQLPQADRMLWTVFDEMIETNRKIGYDALVLALMRRLAWWQRRVEAKFTFNHISDNSAFNQFRPGSQGGGSYDVMDVERESRKHAERLGLPPIRMVPAPKFQGSVEARVRLLMNLLQREEIVFSCGCTKTLEMLQKLESEKQEEGKKYDPSLAFSPRRSQYLHGFDSLTYPILTLDVRRARVVTGQAETQQVMRIGA